MTQIKIVIGSNFGDEGKGLMTDYFAENMMRLYGSCLNVLSNGGAQRGHTAVRGGMRHVFRHLGSGTLCGADTYFPEQFLINPMIFRKEYRELAEQEVKSRAELKETSTSAHHEAGENSCRLFLPGIRLGDCRIYIHPKCPVTTPYEMITNLILEEARGSKRHGSVGVGIWETVIGGGKCFGELEKMSREERRQYLLQDRKERMIRRLADQGVRKIPGEWEEIFEEGGLIEGFLDDLEEMEELVRPAGDEILRSYEGILFENGQGLLLERRMKWKGYGDHTTPSYTGVRNPVQILKNAFLTASSDGAGVHANLHETAGRAEQEPYGRFPVPETIKIEAVYVTRTYMTRHGAGRFDTECPKEEINPAIRDLTNLPNPSQGTIRFGKLNYRSLLRRVQRDFRELEADPQIKEAGIQTGFSIAATHLNEYNELPERSPYIRYKSSGEEGQKRIIIG